MISLVSGVCGYDGRSRVKNRFQTIAVVVPRTLIQDSGQVYSKRDPRQLNYEMTPHRCPYPEERVWPLTPRFSVATRPGMGGMISVNGVS
jgi:hypothetical protein